MSTPSYPYFTGPLRLVGKWSGRRLDSQKKVSGQMPFGDDWNMPNQAFMAIKSSAIPAGTILSMDTSAAMAIPGVLAIITPNDVKNNPAWKTIALPETGFFLLPYDQVRCGGEEIAAVAAEDPYTAEQACQAIKVTYQSAPFVLAPEDAVKSTAPQVIAGTPNAVTPSTASYGNADAALAASGVKLFSNYRYETQNLQHNCILPYAFTVSYDATGRVEMWTSTQGPKQMAQALGTALGIPNSRINVTNYACDGGFGDKGGPLMAMRPHILGALLSQMTGRPIHHQYTHEDNLTLGFHSSKQIYYVTTAVQPNGTITGLECTNYNCGSAFGDSAAGPSAGAFYGPYRLPNYKVTTNDTRTNTGKAGPYRAPGAKAAMFAAYSHYDMIAASLGMNPVDFMNAQTMYKQGDTDLTTGNRIPSVDLPDCLTQAVAMSGFASKWKAPPTAGPSLTGVRHGIGISTASPGNGAGASSCTALAYMSIDGSVNLMVEPNSLGQGNREEKIIIAAEMMGLPFNMVTLNNYQTDAGIDVGSTVGSGSTKRSGTGIGAACIDARNQMLTKAAATLSAGDTTKLTYALDGSMRIFLTADPTKYVTFASLTGEPQILGVGRFIAPTKTSGKSFNTSVVEVDVDCDTGIVTPTAMYVVQGSGKTIYAAGAEGQGQGSAMQGFGYAIQEDQWPDVNTGLPYMINHLDNKLPLANQAPTTIQVGFVERVEQPPDGYNFGAKGLGEDFIGNFTAATCNAVSNAIGWWPSQMPLTPDKILKALGKA